MKPGNLQECARCQFRQRMALKDEIRTSLPHLRMRFYFLSKKEEKTNEQTAVYLRIRNRGTSGQGM